MLNKPLGFEEENVVVIESAFALNNSQNTVNWSRFETFKSELTRMPNVLEASITSAMPGDILPGYVLKLPGSTEKESMITRNLSFDNEMVETLGLQLKEGRFFSKEFNDSLSTILNESALNKLGIVDPIGKKIININDSCVWKSSNLKALDTPKGKAEYSARIETLHKVLGEHFPGLN